MQERGRGSRILKDISPFCGKGQCEPQTQGTTRHGHVLILVYYYNPLMG